MVGTTINFGSYKAASRVVTSSNSGNYAEWLGANQIIKPKLVVANTIPEAIPTPLFFENLALAKQSEPSNFDSGIFRLIYIGRLHKEKCVEDLLRVVFELSHRDINVSLTIIGDGSDGDRLKTVAGELGIEQKIRFLGWKVNSQLPHYLCNADAFVAAYGGGTIREVSLYGLPIIAYDSDWLKGLLCDEKTFLAAPPGDIVRMADKVEKLIYDNELRHRLSANILDLGWTQWSDRNTKESIGQIFDGLTSDRS
jgi:glycosyltransferase involved in cell wall biosynthesis